ncbi:MAG: AmmeMemoRadiSam system protein B [Waddliaceae bacterium]|nr:AmmeMemoRadiSam system protein B [Waddliaceae bacterium]MBT3578620.1 AmmeMemoRadiSam system protein B [Waddliaceae bacterium]MBT4445546.1 AmmeMemoRadiSam system protein B [Waddliaceae bacterium]MBT6928393.1 AmmeMemoRadiSam system protein B [Waddliaceae bacterium]MBT7265079.1 AmmeMemoRadiSam system protein B [Waddliaceae bacterium]
MTKIRKPAVAGTFYPSSPLSLHEMIQGFLDNVDDATEIKDLKAIIVPHAGLVYSGQVAAYAYKILEKHKKRKAIIVGPAHTAFLNGYAADDNEQWETPFGTVKITENTLEKNSNAHRSEHCLEVQIPFLQEIFDDIEILPIVVGDADAKALADDIMKILDDDTILIISSDLSHFNDYDVAVDLDNTTIKAVEDLDYEALLENGDACGKIPLLTMIEIAKKQQWKPTLLKYANSGDVTGDTSRVVGYASFIFH